MMNLTEVPKQFNLNHGGYTVNMMIQMFWTRVIDLSLTYRMTRDLATDDAWECYLKFMEENPNWTIDSQIFNTKDPKMKDTFEVCLLRDTDDAVIRIDSDSYSTDVVLACKTKEGAESIYDLIVQYFPPKKKKEPEQALKMDFWYMSDSPCAVTRTIEVPNWEQVRNNYTGSIIEQMEQLIKLERPKDQSKLVIFNGLPGCGKTYLLRTLLWEWRKWAKADFVLDPETLFQSPSYLLKLVLDTEDSGMDDEEEEKKDKKKWRVLILEDADSYISKTAKTEYGQQVSRLLNLLDGLVGQGLNLMVIMTANEEHNKIHDAMKRPGRCLMNLMFDGFTKQEAINWLESKGLNESHLPKAENKAVGFRSSKDNTESYSLAELYQIAKENNVISPTSETEVSETEIDDSVSNQFIDMGDVAFEGGLTRSEVRRMLKGVDSK